MQYEAYPNEKNTPSRKSRKAERLKVFLHNKSLAAIRRREKKAARKAAREATEE